MIKATMRFRKGAIEEADASGAVVLRLSGTVSVPEALALVREDLPPSEEGRGWALYVPVGVTIGCTAAVDIRVGDRVVKAGDLLCLNFAWRTSAGRVLLRCAASATVDGRRDTLFPVDFYEEQLRTIGIGAGSPLRFEGWQLVHQDRLRAAYGG